ncbi:type III PLP-dependent enzyme [Marivibrio halodurans]|uniref:ornithine decarboxylase n=2 Tax=Marivibrio halodurans TaxID=2039722 RepID=A0A8J7V1Y5_9PROT|nr:type III PLP-dependent enzyme [Marivibrio halodurans]
MSPHLAAWFAGAGLDRAHLAIDLAAVGARYRALSAALSPTHIHYAVKANPEAPVLRLLAEAGANFDVASRGEIDMCLALGIAADRLSFGNTVKKRADIAHAYAKGVRLFAFDSAGELDKLADAAPGALIYCRLLTDGAGADWPLSRKFGCADAMAEDLLRAAHGRGFTDLGISFHVGSQQTRLAAWDAVLDRVAALYDRLAADGIHLSLVNIGGGFPARYRGPAPDPIRYAEAVAAAVAARFGSARPVAVIAEPGRGLVADAGVIEAEVMLVAEKGDGDPRRWVTLDIGKFTGLAETMDEAIKYRILTPHDGGPTGPVVLSGPTCDSADVLYEQTDIRLPLALREGDRVYILGCGAYTQTYSSVGFNGFDPLGCSCV